MLKDNLESNDVNEFNELNLNFLWIGSPPSAEKITYHDILGPLSVAATLKRQQEKGLPTYPIFFWCLDAYVEYYKNIFFEKDALITVKPINSYLIKQSLSDNKELAKGAENLLALLNDNDDSSNLNIKIKDGFALFLVATRPGYVLDTNVVPFITNDKGICLEQYNEMRTAPNTVEFDNELFILLQRYSYLGVNGNDFHFMFSPKVGDPKALKAFQKWLVVEKGTTIPFSNLAIPLMNSHQLGFIKTGFKSYSPVQQTEPFFSWISPFNESIFSAYLSLIDLNQIIAQTPYLFSPNPVSFVTASENISPQWLKDNITTDDAYVLLLNSDNRFGFSKTNRKGLYYYSKLQDTLECIIDDSKSGVSMVSCYRHFPSEPKWQKEECAEILISDAEKLKDCLNWILYCPESNKVNMAPYLLGKTGETLLHRAIILNIFDAIEFFVKQGVFIDAVAKFINPINNTEYSFTPFQLAKFLNRDDKILTLLSKRPLIIEEKNSNLNRATAVPAVNRYSSFKPSDATNSTEAETDAILAAPIPKP